MNTAIEYLAHTIGEKYKVLSYNEDTGGIDYIRIVRKDNNTGKMMVYEISTRKAVMVMDKDMGKRLRGELDWIWDKREE